MTALEKQVSETKIAFADLAGRFGYRRAIRELNRLYDRETITAMETQSRSSLMPSAHGKHTLDPANVQAARKYAALHDRTA